MNYERKRLAAPLTAQIEVTNLCNHRCVHCYNLDSNVENRPSQLVSDAVVLACAHKLIQSGIFGIIITGGEPLIKKELTKKLISLFKENNIRVSLNSNITLFDDDFIEFLRNQKVGVLTSCPSSNPNSYAQLVGVNNYSIFERNLKKILQAGISVSVNMVVTKDNLSDIRSTALSMKELGCHYFAATPMALNMDYPRRDLLISVEEVRQVISDLLWIEKDLGIHVDILEALPKCTFPINILQEKHAFLNRSCQAGKTVIAVSCNGEVRPCAHNSNSYGNILEEDLRNIWTKMGDWRSDCYIPQICKECEVVDQCHCGCRTSAFGYSGSWDTKDVWCTEPLHGFTNSKNEDNNKLLDDTKLKINSDYVYRLEYEDTFVVYNTKDDMYFMINKAFLNFILYLKELGVISYGILKKDLSKSTQNESFEAVIAFMLKKKMLKILQ